MNCNDATLKIQALIDKELPEQEITDVVQHIESCYKCRDEYVEMLKLERQLKGLSFPEPAYDWYAVQKKKFLRSVFSFIGRLLILFCFSLLFLYGVIELLRNNNVTPIIQISTAGITVGIGLLVFISISDRMAEKKNDKYKGIMK